jgi:putative component of membrane protein insertase Oxa1/YidC/SpoIIIJ protein YidD
MRIALFVWYIPRNVVCLIIRGYQKTFSPDHGFIRRLFPNGYCRFTPTCSEYGEDFVANNALQPMEQGR